MMKMQKNAKTVLSAVLTAMFALCALFSAAFYRPVRAAEEAVVLSDGGAETTTLDVNPFDGSVEGMPDGHLANMPAGCIGGGGAYDATRVQMLTAENGASEIPEGSADQKVMRFTVLSSHQEVARISFAQSVKAAETQSIRVRLYVDLADDTASEDLILGTHYLLADRFDMQNQYWYELGLRYNQQMQWITIEISGADVMRLADEDGNIGALYVYYDTYSNPTKLPRDGHIFIDEITCMRVSEEGGGTCLTTLSPRTAVLDTNPKANDENIPDDTGIANMPYGCIGGGAGFNARATDMAAMPAGSSDGFGYSFGIDVPQQAMAHIAFMQYKDGESTPHAVPAAQIGTLKLKMYIDVETDTTEGSEIYGDYYLLADRYDMQNQYWYEFTFLRDMQRQWIEVEIGGSDIMRLADENGNIGGLYFYYDTNTSPQKPTGGTIYIDEITYTPAEEGAHEGGDPYLTTMSMYTSVLDADPKNNDAYLLEHGFANMPAGFLYGSGGGFGTRVTNMAALPEGSSDGEGLSFEILNAGQEIAHIAFTRYADGAVTPYSVAAADIYGITVKMYVDVETDASAGTAVNGKYYLLADRYDMQNQYWYELNFTRDMQGQWIYVHISGDELSKLADEDGNIGGLYFYYDTYSDSSARPTGGKIYIDEIRFDDYTVQKTGGDAQESQTMLYGQTVSELTPPAKEGHDFAGWQTQEGVAATGTQIFGVDITGDITLVAQYTVNEYTLTFVVEGGTVAPITQDYGTAVTEPQAPVKEGYTFLGWFEDGENEAFVFSTMPARNITLTARYEINEYTLTFVAEGGTVAPITQNYGTAVTAPQAPVKEGHTFLGWFEEGEDEAFEFTTMPARNVTLTAKYEINEYTLTFVAEGGTVAPITQNYGTAVTAPQAPVKEGYTFLGWFEDGKDEAFVFSTMPARNITLTARYEINEYTVTVKADGRNDITLTKQYGEKITETDLSEYVPEGFVFDGLFTDAALTQPYDTEAFVESDLTLYVRWTQTGGQTPGGEDPGEETPGGDETGETDAGGCSGSVAGGTMAIGLSAVAAVLGVCLIKKKENR